MLPDPSSTRRRLVMIAAAGAVLVVLIGVGLYGLTVGAPATPPPAAQSTTDPDTRPPPTAPPSSAATTAAPPGDTLPALPHTDDPIVYARAVAEILLAWDTMSALAPGDHAQQVLEDADPAGLETPVLAADVANYLPTIETWQQLRGQRTVQSVTIHTVYIPASWDGIATSPAAEQQLRKGTVAVTIEATRHRAGVWLDEAVKADHPTAFTVFLACPPAFDRCHTLRLSRLDEPLP
ncbi:hypothetical protein FTX61_13510 [Nitriliruptoraceae bacterium ZYF776]|nr:hypothetical protein [Profundirhabdus halotolerans]